MNYRMIYVTPLVLSLKSLGYHPMLLYVAPLVLNNFFRLTSVSN